MDQPSTVVLDMEVQTSTVYLILSGGVFFSTDAFVAALPLCFPLLLAVLTHTHTHTLVGSVMSHLEVDLQRPLNVPECQSASM